MLFFWTVDIVVLERHRILYDISESDSVTALVYITFSVPSQWTPAINNEEKLSNRFEKFLKHQRRRVLILE